MKIQSYAKYCEKNYGYGGRSKNIAVARTRLKHDGYTLHCFKTLSITPGEKTTIRKVIENICKDKGIEDAVFMYDLTYDGDIKDYLIHIFYKETL